jgi:methionyl-tRNA formyltransferase
MKKLKTILFLDGSNISKYLLNQIKKKKIFKINLIVLSTENKKKVKNILNLGFKILYLNFKRENDLVKIKEKFDIGFSYYNYKVPGSILKKIKIGGINFHPSYLPFNRSRHSAFWSIIDNNPAGATSHWMNDKFDDGPIFFQKKIIKKKFINAKKLYEEQLMALKNVIRKTLQYVIKNEFIKKNQNKNQITFHSKKDILKKISFDLKDKILNEHLIKIILGTTFDKSTGFYLKNKKKYLINSSYKIKKQKKKIAKHYLNFSELFKLFPKKRKYINNIYYKNFLFKIHSKIT